MKYVFSGIFYNHKQISFYFWIHNLPKFIMPKTLESEHMIIRVALTSNKTSSERIVFKKIYDYKHF